MRKLYFLIFLISQRSSIAISFIHTRIIYPFIENLSQRELFSVKMIEQRANSLQVNPDDFHYPTGADIRITSHGSYVYWAITAVMIFATMCFLGLSFRVPRSKRVFHYITAAITMTASIAYFTMASNLGYAAIIQEFQRGDPLVRGVYREIFYVRYIDWVVTTPVRFSPSFYNDQLIINLL